MNRTETFQLTAQEAEAYEELFVPGFFAQWAPCLLTAAGVTRGQRVLDVGCGTGIVARQAAALAGEVIGVDLNDSMLTVARRVAPQLEFHQADAVNLPFEAAHFDVVLSQMALMFFPDPVLALREMRRVGRTVGVLVPGALGANPPYGLFAEVVGRHAGAVGHDLVTGYFSLGDRLPELFESAGLVVTATEQPTGELRYPSIDQAVEVELDTTPLGSQLTVAVRTQIVADSREALADYALPSGEVVFPFECSLVIARSPE